MSKTFEFQKQLKTLPLSNLIDVGRNFLNWLEPLVSKEQFKITKNNLENFMSKDALILEKKLVEFSEQNDGNWLSGLWKDMYLDIRDPLVIDVNYFVKLITSHLKNKYASNDIAGVIISKLFDIYESISSESFQSEKIKDIPICMASYKEMFKATRIPKKNRDEYIVKDKTLNSHIIVMYKNHMFKLNLTNTKGERYSCKMIINTLNHLLCTKIEENKTSIGLITTTYRNEAALLLEEITSIEKNKKNHEIVKDALFMVCMDENSKTLNEFAMSLIGSNENNRYFDKNLQLIFNQNADFGFNLEHTGADAGSWINIINMLNEDLFNIEEHVTCSSKESIEINQLHWELNLELETKLNKIRATHHKKLEDIQFEIMYFEDFGSKRIKSLKYSPDAFLHLALQLAQYRSFNKLRSTYEAASMRSYLNGRTECNRPISNEVLDFVKAFDKSESNTTNLKELMSAACKKHSSRIKDCLGSNGVERYFFAIKKMYSLFSKQLPLKEMPEFFEDIGYKELTYSFISTSRIESKYFDLGGFGPVVPDGYGFWYNLLENKIDMNLITRKSINEDDAKVFSAAIMQALKDLEQLASR